MVGEKRPGRDPSALCRRLGDLRRGGRDQKPELSPQAQVVLKALRPRRPDTPGGARESGACQVCGAADPRVRLVRKGLASGIG